MRFLLAAFLAFLVGSAQAQNYPPNPIYNSMTLQTPLGIASGGTGANSAASALITLGTAPLVANTAVLAASATALYPNGVIRATDGVAGAPPLFFTPLTGTCAANGLVSDGGSCVNSTGDGVNSWKAQFGPTADLREWGNVNDNTTDNHTALQAAFTWAGFAGGKLCIPPGNGFYSSAGVTVSLPSAGALYVGCAGTLRFGASAGDAITVNVNGANSSVHFADFTCATGGTGNGDCLHLHQTQAIASPAYTARSDIIGVTFRGADALGGSDYWKDAIWLDSVSNVEFDNDYLFGALLNQSTQYALGQGINLAGGGDNNHIGVAYNIKGSAFNTIDRGIIYGPYIQGVTVSAGSNFTGCDAGVLVPSSGVSQAQLGIDNSQFNCFTSDVVDFTGVPSVMLTNNLFYMFGGQASTSAIFEQSPLQFSLVGNTVSGAPGIGAGSYGVQIAAGSSNAAALILGNSFQALPHGILLAGSSVQNTKIQNNTFAAVTVDVVNNSLNGTNVITGLPSTSGLVTNVVGNGGSPALDRLTISPNTNGFVTGEVVSVSGVGGVPANIVSPISVVDSTHIDLLGGLFSGSYSSGGQVSSLP